MKINISLTHTGLSKLWMLLGSKVDNMALPELPLPHMWIKLLLILIYFEES